MISSETSECVEIKIMTAYTAQTEHQFNCVLLYLFIGWHNVVGVVVLWVWPPCQGSPRPDLWELLLFIGNSCNTKKDKETTAT